MQKPKCRNNCARKTHPRVHWTKKHGRWKPKYQFQSESEALSYIVSRHMNKYRAYACPECGAWHIGYHKDDED